MSACTCSDACRVSNKTLAGKAQSGRILVEEGPTRLNPAARFLLGFSPAKPASVSTNGICIHRCASLS
ncbi:hypothetical protein IF2G_08539 [Cordyceps javanica]|nr:hypothetical protein IF2G_08539 [Cordyceps javanica]